MNLQDSPPLSPAALAVVLRYAQRRGISPNNLNAYLNPQIMPRQYPLADVDRFTARLQSAIENGERVLIFGDYDADGITSTAILLRFFRECTPLRPDWRLPNRKTDQYGLDLDTAKKLVSEHQPSLLLTLDNGTNSFEAVAWLASRGVDVLIVDHHPVTTRAQQAKAIINPKAHLEVQSGDLSDLCTAGLALFLCHHLADVWNCASKWDCASTTMIAGIGTFADAVRQSSTNRAITKNAIRLLNTPAAVNRCTGLQALLPDDDEPLTQRRIEFQVVPLLNALGRLDAPDPGVRLLITEDVEEARRIANRCRELNEQRKKIQQDIVTEGLEQGRALLTRNPLIPVLLLTHADWLPGVVGPAASRVSEQLQRSAILAGFDAATALWRGSGRAIAADNLGAWIEIAKDRGLIERGGGHPGAVGITAHDHHLTALRSGAEQITMPRIPNHEPRSEVIGDFTELPPEEWWQVLNCVAPFGRGNPWPIIRAHHARLMSPPSTLCLRDSGKPWATKGRFRINRHILDVIWRDPEQAAKQWIQNGLYDLQLELNAKNYNSRLCYNWSVASCPATGLSTDAQPKSDHSSHE